MTDHCASALAEVAPDEEEETTRLQPRTMTSEYGESLEVMKARMRGLGLSEDDIQQEQEIREEYLAKLVEEAQSALAAASTAAPTAAPAAAQAPAAAEEEDYEMVD